jgi:hypothetical protein
MNPVEEKVGRVISWIAFFAGAGLSLFGVHSLVFDGYSLQSLWMAGAGLVLVLAFGSNLLSKRI